MDSTNPPLSSSSSSSAMFCPLPASQPVRNGFEPSPKRLSGGGSNGNLRRPSPLASQSVRRRRAAAMPLAGANGSSSSGGSGSTGAFYRASSGSLSPASSSSSSGASGTVVGRGDASASLGGGVEGARQDLDNEASGASGQGQLAWPAVSAGAVASGVVVGGAGAAGDSSLLAMHAGGAATTSLYSSSTSFKRQRAHPMSRGASGNGACLDDHAGAGPAAASATVPPPAPAGKCSRPSSISSTPTTTTTTTATSIIHNTQASDAEDELHHPAPRPAPEPPTVTCPSSTVHSVASLGARTMPVRALIHSPKIANAHAAHPLAPSLNGSPMHQPPSNGARAAQPASPGAPSAAAAAAAAAGGSLDHIPLAFVLQRLHEHAGRFWSNPRTSDVRLVIPVRPQAQSHADSDHIPGTRGLTTRSTSAAAPASSTPSTPTHSAPPRVPAVSYPLHRDYLVPQSTLLRTVLCGGLSPGSPELKGCHVLPFTSLHGPRPVYVPLPDPDSFGVLVHWLYWGDVGALEGALTSGAVSWRGLVANIDYLGLDDRTKRAVGRWWRRWVKTEERESVRGESDDEEDGSPRHWLNDNDDRDAADPCPLTDDTSSTPEGEHPPTELDAETGEVGKRIGLL